MNVQRAIHGIPIGSDYQQIAKAEPLRTLREHRLRSPDGQELIGVLIRRLQDPEFSSGQSLSGPSSVR